MAFIVEETRTVFRVRDDATGEYAWSALLSAPLGFPTRHEAQAHADRLDRQRAAYEYAQDI